MSETKATSSAGAGAHTPPAGNAANNPSVLRTPQPHRERVKIDAVVEHERRLIARQREIRGVGGERPTTELTAVAISGGGIRSASFGMGVLQALAHHNMLQRIDYLSTVSGGGYIGSSLTWFLSGQGGKAPAGKFPFAKAGARIEHDGSARVRSASVGGARGEPQEQITPVDFIRQHGNYLTPGDGLGPMSFLASVLRSVLLSGSVYFVLLAGVFAGLIGFDLLPVPRDAERQGLDVIADGTRAMQLGEIPMEIPRFLIALLGTFVAVTVVYALLSTFNRGPAMRGYSLRVAVQRLLGLNLTAVGVLLLLASVPYAHVALCSLTTESGSGVPSMAAGGAATAGGAAAAVVEFLRQRAARAAQTAPMAVRISVAALLLVYGLCLLAYMTAGWALAQSIWVLPTALGSAVLLGVFVNVNYFGIGRLYRDRLMETFLPDVGALKKQRWQPATIADAAKLSSFCHPLKKSSKGPGTPDYSAANAGPYHLINCNAVLVDSEQIKYRGRGGDSFLLSPLYCGSDSTWWYDTRHFLNDGMTLSTAMSISGAAANPHTGVAGQGPTRNRAVSFLMSFVGLRLGYWARNPYPRERWRRMLAYTGPNLIYPGIVQGLFGQRLNAHAGFLDLTDGGHFENLGLYELLRRRAKLIIASDASADGEFTMSGLSNAIERARVDHNCEISFDDSSCDLQWLMPGSYRKEHGLVSESFAKQFDLAERGYAIAHITYDSGEGGERETGTLIYIKATLTPGLPADLYAYRKAQDAFPHQSTADQFFDEVQFESYRNLGFELTSRMLREVMTRTFRVRATPTASMPPPAFAKGPTQSKTG